jgi:hypothetical protein
MVQRDDAAMAWRKFGFYFPVSPLIRSIARYGVRGVAVSARLVVNQRARVRLPSDTLLRVCSRESRQPPKLPHGVRLLALVLY